MISADPENLVLPLGDVFLVVGGCGFATHFIFKNWEPVDLPTLTALLVIIPSSFSYLFMPYYTALYAVLLSFLVYFVALSASILLYRLSPFHPLARYPGPVLCKISMVWMTRIIMGGKRHLYIQALHNLYGDIVRIGPNEVSIRDVSAISPLMGTTGLPKGPSLIGRSMHAPLPSLIALRDPVEHATRRKPWNRAFSTAAIKEYEPIIAKRVEQFVEALASETRVTDLRRWIDLFTFDFMGDMAFGGGTELMRNGDQDGLLKVMEKGLRVSMIFESLPWLSVHARKLPWFGEGAKRMRELGLSRAAKRFKNGSTKKDLFYYLSNEDGVEKEFPSPARVISDGVLAVIAGSDTTSGTLSNIFYFLMRYPDVYQRLRAEIDCNYPPGEDSLNTARYPKMTYLDAVINETLRLYPAVLSGSQRAPTPGTGGKLVGPYFLPEGTNARIHFYSLHRDPRNFYPLPDSFWPDRWLIAEGEQSAPKQFVHNPSAFVPFSFGPSNCVGKNLAMQEMRMLLCFSFQHLDFRFAEGWDSNEWEDSLEDFLVTLKGHLPVIVKPRNG